MDVKYINPFLNGIKTVLEQYQITDIKVGKLEVKEDLNMNQDVIAFTTVMGQVKGNVAYAYNTETAKKIVSLMIMSEMEGEFDEFTRSAMGEFSNMITSYASNSFIENNMELQIMPPTVAFGEDVFSILSSVKTISAQMITPLGNVEICIAMEI